MRFRLDPEVLFREGSANPSAFGLRWASCAISVSRVAWCQWLAGMPASEYKEAIVNLLGWEEIDGFRLRPPLRQIAIGKDSLRS